MATIGTRIYSWLNGEKVGDDEFGNRYYRSKKKGDGAHVGLGTKERRWVIYNGKADPSRVPAYWHGWLHYTTDDVPSEEDKQADYIWEKPHQQNLTGTPFAYVPDGHLTKGGQRARAVGDYEAWTPK